MTKQEWLDRCAMVYDLGMVETLPIALQGMDYFIRKKASKLLKDEEQEMIAYSIMDEEIKRSKECLFNDREAYTSFEALYILTKACQKCATTPDAWHCRAVVSVLRRNNLTF